MPTDSKLVPIPIPADLIERVRERVQAGAFKSEQELVAEALRYWLERHSDEAWEQYVDQELDWSQRVAGS